MNDPSNRPRTHARRFNRHAATAGPRIPATTDAEDAVTVTLHSTQPMRDTLTAGSRLVVFEGSIALRLRPHALAWLAAEAPVIRIVVRKGEEYVARDGAAAELCSLYGQPARFQLQPPRSFIGHFRHAIAESRQQGPSTS